MSSSKPTTDLQSLGEFGLIQRIEEQFRPKQPTTQLGIGDDAALISTKGESLVLSTDLLIEGIHFDLMYHPLKHLGYKAVVVNLSDIFAMNARPQQITFSLAMSNRFNLEAVNEIYAGVRKACEYYGVDLVGGDTSTSHKGLFISVTALGQAPPAKIVKRSGASVGDIVAVSGDLGAAYLGLQILEREKQIFLENPEIQPNLAQHQYVVQRFLKPEARHDIVEHFLRSNIKPTAMIDVSDGLSSDLLHLCQHSEVGCEIFEENLPIDQRAHQLAMDFNIAPTTCALNGGEDYELLFTMPQGSFDKFEGHMDAKVIGKIVAADKGCHLISPDGSKFQLTAQGWNALKN